MTDIINKRIAKGQLLALDVSEQEATHICDGGTTVAWVELAKRDGGLAIQTLTNTEFQRIADRLVEDGLRPELANDRASVVGVIVEGAKKSVPTGAWYDSNLHSAIACAFFLSLVQDVFTIEDTAQAESQEFAKLLGVDADKPVEIITP